MYGKYFHSAKKLTNLCISLNESVFLRVNYENYTSKRWAGHSKWQNTKSIKQAMNQAKSNAFGRIIRLIGPAVREGGENMAQNAKLRALWEDARKVNMPKSTFEGQVKYGKTETKPHWTVFSGPKGVVVGIEVMLSNKTSGFMKNKLSHYLKKVQLKLEPHFDNFCIEKGLIITDPLPQVNSSYDTAVEHAIEIGVDEVFENDDKNLVFECLPDRLDSLTQKLENKGYNILSSSTELDFKEFINLSESEVESLENIISKLKDLYPEIIRASYNSSS